MVKIFCGICNIRKLIVTCEFSNKYENINYLSDSENLIFVSQMIEYWDNFLFHFN